MQTLVIFGFKFQQASVSRELELLAIKDMCSRNTMTKYAIPWDLRSRARCDSLPTDARLMPTRLSTRIASSIIVAIRVAVESSALAE